jgi:hypothetical protein
MGHEAAAAKLAVEAVLPGTLFESAPQNAVLPYKLCRQRSPGTDSQVIGGVRAMTSPLVDVGIWVEWDPYSAVAQTGAKEIDEAMESLRSYSVTDANGDTWEVSSRSEGGAWVREEVDTKAGGKKFYWVGRSYRLSISAA